MTVKLNVVVPPVIVPSAWEISLIDIAGIDWPNVVFPEMTPELAVIIVEPSPVPVANPDEFIVATDVLDEDQVTELVILAVLESQ